MEFITLGIKQEAELNFVGFLPHKSNCGVNSAQDAFTKLKKINFWRRTEVKLFENYENCGKCGIVLKSTKTHTCPVKKMFRCDLCPFVTSQRGFMMMHAKTHMKKYECNRCTKNENGKLIPVTHTRSRKCLLCSFKFVCNLSRDEHFEKHRDEYGNIKCPREDCAKSCKNVKQVQRHIYIHHASIEERTCKICLKVLKSRETLGIHMRLLHFRKESLFMFDCDFCPFRTDIKSTIRSHVMIHAVFRKRKFSCDKCGKKLLNRTGLRCHFKQKPSKCVFCNINFSCTLLLAQHNEKVHKTWPCKACGKVLGSNTSYESHLKVIHGTSIESKSKFYKDVNCEICSEKFVTRKHYVNHLKEIHKMSTKFKCHVCGINCRGANRLRSHLENHKKSKAFQCDKCPYASLYEAVLKSHHSTHHNPKSAKRNV